jgi:hypothetical protein
MTNIDYKKPIYGFMLSCEYHIVTKLSSDKYGVVPLFTESFGNDIVESDSLETTLELCKEQGWNVKEFKTYQDFLIYGVLKI